jgi:predicted esterase
MAPARCRVHAPTTVRRPCWRIAAALGALALTSLVDPRARRAAEPPAPPLPPAAAPVEEAPPPPTFPQHRTQIAVPENNPLEIYPPRFPGSALPLTVALHGKDMDPVDLCEGWSAEGRAQSWLVCPAGNAPSREAFDWSGTVDERLAALDTQLAAVEAVYGPLVDHARGDVLVGFSRGGFLARDLVYARPGRFRGLVFLGAAVRLDPERLRAAGVRRVLLAAGDQDDARSTMQHTALRLAALGMPARFVGLGPIAHVLPKDLDRVMRDALAWVRAEGG